MPPAPSTVGPFRIGKLLGRGGMGVVYDAVHETTGARVALKTVLRSEHRSLADLRREIHALKRLRHRGIVRIVEDGVQGGTPWYAMELCEGRTLRSVITGWEGAALASTDGWWTGRTAGLEVDTSRLDPAQPPLAAPEPEEPEVRRSMGSHLAAVLELVGRLCAPLAHMHAEGLVHRDLKPENVIVGNDGWPVIVDFGLVTPFLERTAGGGRDSLGMTADLSGTVAYVAPEQSRGEVVDARADLYSLGCILYELLTGRPPFVSRSVADLLVLHHSKLPDRPSALADGIPPSLDELVMSLLQKDPNDRIGYADVVAERIAALGGPAVEARSGSYLYRPRLVGRDAPRAELHALLAEASRGGGSIACIVGESGSGKTRMALELAMAAGRRLMAVEHGECHRRGAPFAPLRSVLRSVADHCHDPTFASETLGMRLRVLEPFEPELAALPGQASQSSPEPLPPAEAALRYHGVLTELLAKLGARRPWLLLLDDLHRADELTLGLLAHLQATGAIARMPLLVLGTCRSDHWERIGARLPGIASVTLPPLSAGDVGRLAAEMLALDELPPPFVEELSARSRGLPSMAAEIVHAVVRAGLLERDLVGVWAFRMAPAELTAALPGSLARSLQERLGELSRRDVVEAAALLGREADAPLLAELAGTTLEEVWDALDELARAHLVEESGGRLRFFLDEHRHALLDGIEPGQRRRLHRRAASALEARPDRTALLPTAARHLELAGDLAGAVALHREAAAHALSIHALEAAEASLRAVLALAPADGDDAIDARRQLAVDVLARRARTPEAVDELGRALAAAEVRGPDVLVGQCLLDRGQVLREHGRLEEARADVMRALPLTASARDRMKGHALLASLALADGDMEEAERRIEAARALLAEAADVRGEATLLGNLAILRKRQGRIAEAEACYREALRITHGAGSRMQAMILANAALLVDEQGRIAEAEEMYRTAVGKVREAGDRFLEGGILANLAGLLGSPELYEEALGIARETGNRRFEGHVLSCLGRIALGRARTAEGKSYLERSLEILGQAKDRRQWAIALGLLATARFDSGEVEAALSDFDESVRAHDEMGDLRLSAIVRSRRARTLRAMGRLDDAEEAAREALAMLEPLGSREECVDTLGELALVALARGGGFDEPIARAERIVAGATWPQENPSRRQHQRLLETRDAFLRGERLLLGNLPDDWPDPVKARLEREAAPGTA